jgi:hypothetical protein
MTTVRGTELARLAGNPEHAAAMEAMRDQLLIVFLKRLGGKVSIPVAEIDNTGNDTLAFQLDVTKRLFSFEILKKQ